MAGIGPARPMEHQLNPDHDRQLVEYLRFLRRKRDTAIAEVAAEFKEVMETRILEDNYAAQDVEDILNGLLSMVRSSMKRDLEQTMFSSVLLLKQVLEEAERSDGGWTLTTNLPATEDISLLRAVEEWDRKVHGSSGSAPPLTAKAAVESRAAPSRALRPVGQTQDPRLLADLQGARDDNASLQERFQRMQVQTSQVLREKSALQAQLDAMSAAAGASDEAEALRAQVDQLQADLQAAYDDNAALQAQQESQPASGSDALMRELHEMQDAHAQLAAQLDQANAELDGRLERSRPFVNLQQMLRKKNDVVRRQREVLQQHGIHMEGDIDANDD